MKKLIALMAIGLAFSACNGKYTIAKRKYTKGFYVSKSNDRSTKPALAENKAVKATREEKIETVVISKTQPEIKATPIEIGAVRPMAETSLITPGSKNAATHHNPVASTSKSNYASSAEIKPIKIDSTMAQKAKKGDTNIVLLVILSLFPILCLIAVYLHDNGVTLNFWIDLLLHLTIIGEVIFALLVVLDIIDLS